MDTFEPVSHSRRKHYTTKSIVEVCSSGDVEALTRMLIGGANPNQQIGGNYTLLSFCFSSDIYRTLLMHKADVNGKDRQSETPLSRAVLRHDLDAAEIFISYGADVNNVSDSGDTPLMHCATTGNTAMTLLILKAGANLDLVNKDGQTAAMIALEHNFDHIIGYLFPKNAPVPSTRDIVDAARKGIMKDVEYFLNQSPSVEIRQAALRAAIISHYPRTVKVLLASSIPITQDIGSIIGRSTPSMYSVVLAKISDSEIPYVLAGAILSGSNNIELIIRRGHSPDMIVYGVPALVYAYINGRVSSFCNLLNLGARPFDNFPRKYSIDFPSEKFVLPQTHIKLPESRNKIADHSMFVANKNALAKRK